MHRNELGDGLKSKKESDRKKKIDEKKWRQLVTNSF
jgi:hypothetical protein